MRAVAGLAFATLLLAGCVGAEDGTGTDGQADYMAMCAACHGSTGRGDGPAAPGLSRQPADLTLLAARNGGEFPMLEVMARIDGYTSDTDAMPEFGQDFDGTPVPFETEPGIFTPTPPRLIALADYVASLQQ